MTSVYYEPNAVRLTVEGHCDAAPYGQDMICAMVSALVQTLAEYADRNDDDDVELRVGYARIAGARRDRMVFDAFALGLECIAEQYPSSVEYVQIEE